MAERRRRLPRLPAALLSLTCLAAMYLPAAAGARVHEPAALGESRGQASAPTPRIAGGELAPEGEYPWMGALLKHTENGREQWCGFTVVRPQRALTAAHCLEDDPLKSFTAAVGSTNYLGPESKRIDVTRAAIHPKWDTKTNAFDAALLKLERPVPADVTSIEPVGGADRSSWSPGDPAVVLGWGCCPRRRFASLRQGSMRIISDAACAAGTKAAARGRPEFQRESMVCAKADPGFPCPGDSGGPLVVRVGSRYKQVGIDSWGRCTFRHPDVFARVARLRGFIEDDDPRWERSARSRAGGWRG